MNLDAVKTMDDSVLWPDATVDRTTFDFIGPKSSNKDVPISHFTEG